MRGAKVPPKITASYLASVTAWYLERWATSRAHLQRLLARRVRASAREHGGEAEGMALVEAELDRLSALGLLDDTRFAADRARALARRGVSRARIRGALGAKGIAADTVRAALDDGGDGGDWAAALTWARKHRVGPWRRQPVDRDGRRKELARLGRAGFPFALASRIVDATDPTELEPPET